MLSGARTRRSQDERAVEASRESFLCHADSGSSLERLSPETHFLSPVLGQILPSGIPLFDQGDLLFPPPALELFFASYGVQDVLIALVINQPVHFVFFSEAFNGIDFMLLHAGVYVAGHADIERASPAGKDVNPELVVRAVAHGERW